MSHAPSPHGGRSGGPVRRAPSAYFDLAAALPSIPSPEDIHAAVTTAAAAGTGDAAGAAAPPVACKRLTAEHQRLRNSELRVADWKRWGNHVMDREWGTVREDYSADGDAWNHVTFDMARSRAFRWGEEGIFGACNRCEHGGW